MSESTLTAIHYASFSSLLSSLFQFTSWLIEFQNEYSLLEGDFLLTLQTQHNMVGYKILGFQFFPAELCKCCSTVSLN